MQIISINEQELERFLSLSDQTNLERVNILRTDLLELWASGHSQPAWCFLAQENGSDRGRVAYRTIETPQEVFCFAVVLPWQADYLSVGQDLFHESLKRLAAQGIQLAQCQVNSQWERVNEAQQVLTAVGFSLRQAKSGFVLMIPEMPVVVPDRLTYRTLAEVGEATFIEAIQQASADTLDSDDRKLIAQFGLQQAAENFFAFLQDDYFSYQPAWWQLAYAVDGALVGFVQPVIFREIPHKGTIGYMGVVPAQRGHHYVDDLLLKAQRIFQEEGVKELIDGTDSENFPMIGAFQRAGYKEDGTNWIYQLALTDNN